MTDMDLDAIDALLAELAEYGSNLMLTDSLPAEVVADLRTVRSDKGTLVHVAEAIDNVLDLRNLSCSVEEG